MSNFFYYTYFWRLQYVGHSFACVAHFVFLRDVWIRTRTKRAGWRASNLATHLPTATHLPLSTHLPKATYLELTVVLIVL
jgi:hypothetical protein